MRKGSARTLAFEAGRAVPVYPPIAAGCGLVAAAGTFAASGRVQGNVAAFAGVGVLGLVVAAVGYKMLTGKGVDEEVKGAARNAAGFLVAAVLGFVVPAALRAMDLTGWAWLVVGSVAGLWLIGTMHWFARDVLPPAPPAAQRTRREAYAQRHKNMASQLDIWQVASPAALRRVVRAHRPSLAAVSPWRLWRMSRNRVHELGVQVATFGLGLKWIPWHRLFVTFEQFTLIFGGPRMGKTLLLAWILRWAPGFALTTSTRSDLAEWGHETRTHAPGWRRPPATWVGRWWWRFRNYVEILGTRAVWVWNPNPEILVESNVKWSILVGCEDYDTASRRAVDLIPDNASGKSDHEIWDEYARNLGGVLLLAARKTNRQVRDIYEWLGDQPLKDEDTCAARREIESAIMLVEDAEQRRILAAIVAEHYSRAPNTRASVTFTLTRALAWLAIPKARALGDCPVKDSTLDIPGMIDRLETLHIIGAEANPALAPLNRCLVGEVYYQLKLAANAMPQERLDPPATLALDEAGNVAKVPLHKWTADLGGKSVCVFASFQSEAQMIRSMGEGPAAETKGNAGNIVHFGGGNDVEGMEKAAAMSGQARFKNAGEEQKAADSHTVKAPMSAADIRALGVGEIYMQSRGLRSVVGMASSILEVPGARRVEVKPLGVDEPVHVLEKAPSRITRIVSQARGKALQPVEVESVVITADQAEKESEEVAS